MAKKNLPKRERSVSKVSQKEEPKRQTVQKLKARNKFFGRAWRFLVSKKRLVLGVLGVFLVSYVLYFFLSLLNGTCVAGNCWFGLSTLAYKDGNVYKGELFLRRPSGNGEFRSPKNEHYLGEWSGGKKNGFGVYTYANGDVYEGHFSNNTKEGMGAFTWKGGGVKYVGNWEDGEPSGKGKLLLNGGQIVLEGEYKKGVIYNGKGMLVYENGNRYIGDWKDGKRHGNGILLESDGNQVLYKGKFRNDQPVVDY
ncbi:MORN repeat-containing protein [Leptospira inadai]|uniref:Membrane-binding protein n=1 Tax=Leptospira inadai serovar Lyme TaxID=293084 RepID=A0ABX4YDB0_9LEPT|nr:membrane-binding protein [Leptospira inadai]PNV72136.1 membrane-binding protein [Leptospira inadai serovar Lyme]